MGRRLRTGQTPGPGEGGLSGRKSPPGRSQVRDRNVGFSVVARTNPQFQGAIWSIIEAPRACSQALAKDGSEREDAVVTEITDLVDLSAWPSGTRLILRREPLHPGAQTSLFPDLEHRCWGHYTDAADPNPAVLDADMRAHAHVEDHIRQLKASGAERFPFVHLDANRAWLALVCYADTLVGWFQLLCLSGALAKAEPKALRWALWQSPTAARVRRIGRRLAARHGMCYM